jgi:hypothetical protein
MSLGLDSCPTKFPRDRSGVFGGAFLCGAGELSAAGRGSKLSGDTGSSDEESGYRDNIMKSGQAMESFARKGMVLRVESRACLDVYLRFGGKGKATLSRKYLC